LTILATEKIRDFPITSVSYRTYLEIGFLWYLIRKMGLKSCPRRTALYCQDLRSYAIYSVLMS